MTSPSDERCESCGKLDSDHRDEWGRWAPCVESIMDTMAFNTMVDWEDTPADREDTRDKYPFAGDL